MTKPNSISNRNLSNDKIEKCIIDADVVNGEAKPQLIYNENRESLQENQKRHVENINIC